MKPPGTPNSSATTTRTTTGVLSVKTWTSRVARSRTAAPRTSVAFDPRRRTVRAAIGVISTAISGDREHQQTHRVGVETADRAQPQRQAEEHAVEHQVEPALLAEDGGQPAVGEEAADVQERRGRRALAQDEAAIARTTTTGESHHCGRSARESRKISRAVSVAAEERQAGHVDARRNGSRDGPPLGDCARFGRDFGRNRSASTVPRMVIGMLTRNTACHPGGRRGTRPAPDRARHSSTRRR